MSRRFAAVVTGLVLVVVTLLAAPARARDLKGEEKPPTDLSALAWLAGDWQGTTPEGDLCQEVWAAPKGDSMMGMWRWISASGGVGLFEFLTLMVDKDGIVMRLRHLDRAGVSREKADKPVTLRLVRAAGREAVFAGDSGKAALTITYRSPGASELYATVEKPGGKEEFRFKRANGKS
jgi:hypothetical protein